MITKPEDAVPHDGRIIVEQFRGVRLWKDTGVFTAVETAQLMRMYGHAWHIYHMCERNIFRDGSRSDYWYCILRDKAWFRIAEIKCKIKEWEDK